MRTRNSHLLLLFAVPLFLPLARAQAPATQPAPPAGQEAASNDFSKGFEKYYQMGLPNVRDAGYVKLNVYNSGLSLQGMRMHELQLDGNAWLLEETEEGRARFVMNPCRVCEVYDFQKASRPQAKESGGRKSPGRDPMSLMFGDGGRVMGQWQKADLARDVAKTVKFLEEKLQNREKRDGTFRQNGYGQLFLTAIHFHAHGYPREANRICDLLFQHSGDYRTVLVQALSVLASAQYEEVCDRFAASGDWAVYLKELKELLLRFPAGWEYGRAVKLLSDRVQGRLDQAGPPSLAGEGLSDEDRKLADELTEAGPFRERDTYPGSNRDLLVLPAAGEGSGDGEAAHPLARLRERGMQAVPLLLAMLKDDYLMRMDTRSMAGGSTHISFDTPMSSGLSDDQVERQYATMRRPAARSDVAVQLLQPLPITGEERRTGSQEVDKEELYEDVKAWYGEHKDKAPVELARLYLMEGSDNQKNAAMQYLLDRGTAEDWQSIEKHLLEVAGGENIMSSMSLASLYVTKRGADAKPFVEKYEALVRGRQDNAEGMFSNEGLRDHLDRFLANLRQLVSAESLEELLEEVAGGRKNAAEMTSVLWQRLSQEKPAAALEALLKAVSKAQDDRVATELLGMTALMSRPSFMRRVRGTDEEPAQTDKLDIAEHADLWRAILADERVAADGLGGPGPTLGDMAAYVIEALYGDDMLSGGSPIHELGDRAGDLMRRRAEARLEGKNETELPELPSAEHVTAERKAEIAAAFAEAAPEAVSGKMTKLNLDELLVLADMVEEDDALNDKFRPASLLIQDVKVTGLGTEETEAWKASIGKPFSMELAQRAFEETRASVEAGARHTASFTRKAMLGGVVIIIQHGESGRPKDIPSSEKRPLVTGMLQAGPEYDHTLWYVKVPKMEQAAETPGSGDVGIEEESIDEEDEDDILKSQDNFWESLEGYLREGRGVCAGGLIRFVGAPYIKDTPAAAPDR